LVFFLQAVQRIQIIFFVDQLVGRFDFLDKPGKHGIYIKPVGVHVFLVGLVNNQDCIVVDQETGSGIPAKKIGAAPHGVQKKAGIFIDLIKGYLQL